MTVVLTYSPVKLVHFQLQNAFQTNIKRRLVHTGSRGTFVPNKANTTLLWKRTAMQLAATAKVRLIVVIKRSKIFSPIINCNYDTQSWDRKHLLCGLEIPHSRAA